MNSSVGRPISVTDKAIISVTSSKAKTKLHEGSERRAIVNKIIEAGGSLSLEKLNTEFGYNVRGKVLVLVSLGWLSASEPVEKKKQGAI